MNEWSKITRWLHAAIAFSIIAQLIFSLVLVPPDEMEGASNIGKFAMEGHELVGLIAVALLFIHWLWLLKTSSDIKLKNLFPYRSDELQQVKTELAYLLENKKLPTAEDHGGLSGLVHGLGIIIASGAAFTGFGLYLVMDFSSKGYENPLFENIAEVHELFGNLMWFYLIAHVLAAAWHEYEGQQIVSKMFKL